MSPMRTQIGCWREAEGRGASVGASSPREIPGAGARALSEPKTFYKEQKRSYYNKNLFFFMVLQNACMFQDDFPGSLLVENDQELWAKPTDRPEGNLLRSTPCTES